MSSLLDWPAALRMTIQTNQCMFAASRNSHSFVSEKLAQSKYRAELMMANYLGTRLGVGGAIIGAFFILNTAPLSATTLLSLKSHAVSSAPALRAFAQAESQKTKQPSANFNPFEALLGKPVPRIVLDAEQRAIVEKVNAYLSGTQILSGNFVQVGPDGSRTTGNFFISKPGKVRFEYSDPNPIELIADGQSVVVRDRKLATQDAYPLEQTPLRFLLSNRVDLLKDTNLISVSADESNITVIAEEDNSFVGKSRLMIIFNAKDMQLKQWTVTDPQGYDTTVAVYNLDTNKKPDPSLFKIDYTNYRNDGHNG